MSQILAADIHQPWAMPRVQRVACSESAIQLVGQVVTLSTALEYNLPFLTADPEFGVPTRYQQNSAPVLPSAIIERLGDSPLEAGPGGADPQVTETSEERANETPLAILLALWAASVPFADDNAVPFSAPFEEVDYDDAWELRLPHREAKQPSSGRTTLFEEVYSDIFTSAGS